MNTSHEALASAHAWQQYAQTQWGVERDNALQVAAYWFEVHRQRAAVETYALPPQKSRGAALWITLGAVVLLVLVSAGAATVSSVLNATSTLLAGASKTAVGDDAADPGTAPEVPKVKEDPVVVEPEPTPEPKPTPVAPPPTARELWTSGEWEKEVPEYLLNAQPTTWFSPDFYHPTDWLRALNPANSDIRAVFTDDVTYNCGMSVIESAVDPTTAVGGCYNPDYPRTVFIYWGPNATQPWKDFILAHELSHLMQWWHKFDVSYSARVSGFAETPEWKTAVEVDASCRVLSWGGYSYEVAAQSSSPCTTDVWSEDWLGQRAAELGITVEPH